MKHKKELREFLEKKVLEYNHPDFIMSDPISVPHRYSKKQDIEIAGLFAAIFSWGNRTTIIRKSNELMRALDDAPYDFIQHHHSADLKKLTNFKHRTFNATDLLYFIHFLQNHYQLSDSLETAFLPPSKRSAEKNQSRLLTGDRVENEWVKNALSVFSARFFSLDNAPRRTRKHISSPEKNSTCKRLNMYLRWMVRNDKQGVDFGIWKKISPADLICPVDLHVARVARGFGLISRRQTDWQTAMELTMALRLMDPIDPVKYDFALFGLGVTEKY
jgi:uncharacterized protein (TIGR02757 family)